MQLTMVMIFSAIFLYKSAAIVALIAVALGVQVPVQLNTSAPALGPGAILANGPVVTVATAPGKGGTLNDVGFYANIVLTGLCTCDS